MALFTRPHHLKNQTKPNKKLNKKKKKKTKTKTKKKKLPFPMVVNLLVSTTNDRAFPILGESYA